MEEIKQKSALRKWIASKLTTISKHFANNFYVWIIILLMPPITLCVILCLQTRKVDEVVTQPLLTGKGVKRLQEQAANSQKQVAHYKATTDSLRKKASSKDVLIKSYQSTADSLLTLHDNVPASPLTAAELTLSLTNYTPKVYQDSL